MVRDHLCICCADLTLHYFYNSFKLGGTCKQIHNNNSTFYNVFILFVIALFTYTTFVIFIRQGKLKAELSVQLQPARQLLPTLTETESYNLKNFNKFPNQFIVFIVFIMLKFES
jgi:hypothetical protein